MTLLETEPGMSRAWMDYALQLREVLKECGVATRPCLPDERDDCGQDYAHHCMSYLAALKAKADNALWHMHHGQPGGERLAKDLYEHWERTFAHDSS
ncbi:hypothetical protein [Streptomyces nigrescens]|uniref:Uncharacterized protein n=1 Tax=Streptomyces nigrescens TaxID=1920 RepID=A0ABY7IT70_STRNI|nr:hypothetical protein [Streptomyces nigrescens]WAU02069.1 hypothetical protein STRNI_000019 [Streptomyces nigrescens]